MSIPTRTAGIAIQTGPKPRDEMATTKNNSCDGEIQPQVASATSPPVGAHGDIERAESTLHEVLVHAPRNVAALHQFGLLARQDNRTELAIRMLTRAAAAAENNATIYLDLARTQHAAQQLTHAAENYQRAINIGPALSEAHFELGAVYRDLGRLDDARTTYNRAIELNPAHAKAHNLSRRIPASSCSASTMPSRRSAAQSSLHPITLPLATTWAAPLQRLGRTKEAIACCEAVISSAPDSIEARANLANLCATLANQPQSQPPPTQAACPGKPNRFPLPPAIEAKLREAAQLFNDNHIEAAAKIAEEVANQASDHPVALRILGVAARRDKRPDDSIALLKRAVALDPGAHALHFELGVSCLESHNQKDAYDCFLRCQELRPEFQPSYINLAGILEQQERYEEALEWGRKAIELKPDCHMANYNVANCYRECGQIEAAIRHYERALQIEPNYPRTNGISASATCI